MYIKGKDIKEKPKPFSIICNNCGSHNVTVTAYDYLYLCITCRCCGAHLSYGSYNETEYYESEE